MVFTFLEKNETDLRKNTEDKICEVQVNVGSIQSKSSKIIVYSLMLKHEFAQYC